jgi:hypothetical protein
MLRGSRELSEIARNPFWRDIFGLAIPTSGTLGARKAVMVSPQSRLSQRIFFSSDCNSDSHNFFRNVARSA